MAKKSSKQSPPSVKARIDVALRQAKNSIALSLAREWYHQEPSDESRALLQQCLLRSIEERIAKRLSQEACVLLNELAAFERLSPEVIFSVSEYYLSLGDFTSALRLTTKLDSTTDRDKILNQVVDHAVQSANPDSLPTDWHEGFERIATARAQYESGDDAAMQESLRGIAANSPFLEWKLLLRGLSAYALGANERAIDNFSRLNPERLPSKLVAPLRFRIDAAFQESQVPKVVSVLSRQSDMLLSSPLLTELRKMQQFSERSDLGLTKYFQHAASIAPTLKSQYPSLYDRVALVSYWLITQVGQPPDLHKYRQVFQSPVEDPEFHRLQAMILESIGETLDAHEQWQLFLKWLAKKNKRWQEPDTSHAQAIIWERMGKNISKWIEFEGIVEDVQTKVNDTFKPNDISCFQKSIDLVPNRVQPWLELFQAYFQRKELQHASTVGVELLQRFPNEVTILNHLVMVELQLDHLQAAVEYARRALQLNPFDRSVRELCGNLLLQLARQAGQEKQVETSRELIAESSAMFDQEQSWIWQVVEAALERKLGNPARYDELCITVRDRQPQLLPTLAYSMLVESITLKSLPADKKRLDQAFNESISDRLTIQEASAMYSQLKTYQRFNLRYTGMKTHETKISKRLHEAITDLRTNEEIFRWCQFLEQWGEFKLLAAVAKQGLARKPNQPIWIYFQILSTVRCAGGSIKHAYRLQWKLDELSSVISLHPGSPVYQELVQRIQRLQAELQRMLPSFANVLDMFMDAFHGKGPPK